MWYSGIDQHKRDSVIATYGPDGPRVKQLRVVNTPLALAQYFADFPAPHRAVVGAAGVPSRMPQRPPYRRAAFGCKPWPPRIAL
jgi:hypothetical protein